MRPERASDNEVGPVLLAGRIADAIVAAIRKQNAGARVSLRGSYVRVAVARRCEVHAREIEGLLGEPFRMLCDLERVMPSFRGRLFLSEDLASWEAGPADVATNGPR
jgi:hypothetical protein